LVNHKRIISPLTLGLIQRGGRSGMLRER